MRTTVDIPDALLEKIRTGYQRDRYERTKRVTNVDVRVSNENERAPVFEVRHSSFVLHMRR